MNTRRMDINSPLDSRLDGTQSWSESDGEEKNQDLAENQTLVVQTMLSHFTEWTNPVHECVTMFSCLLNLLMPFNILSVRQWNAANFQCPLHNQFIIIWYALKDTNLNFVLHFSNYSMLCRKLNIPSFFSWQSDPAANHSTTYLTGAAIL
jgi:hypothetical protein